MSDTFSVRVEGLDKLERNMAAIVTDMPRYFDAAGNEIGNEVLDTEGLRKYPPSTGANAAPYPFYVRGKGTQYSETHNDMRSEKYGASWTVKTNNYTTTIGNKASYAGYLAGLSRSQPPARHMARLGWRSLFEVAEEKLEKIRAIYQRWVNKLIRDKGLD